MAEEHHHNKTHEERCEEPVMVEDVDVKERGMFDFLGGKKEVEKPQDDVKGGEYGEEPVILASEFEEKVTVNSENPQVESSKEHEDKKHHVGLLEKLRRSDSSSSSSSEEEGCEEAGEEERKKKKKEKKEQKKKLEEDKKKRKDEEDVMVPVEKCDVEEPVPSPEEKKGFLGKIKDKLPGQHKKAEEVPPPPPQAVECYATTEVPPPPCQEGGDQAKEKKGIFEKIKEKLPGFHHKDEEEEKEKEKGKC